MSSAIRILRQEHELIMRAVDATEAAARHLEQGRTFPPATLSALMHFFSFVAHRSHRDKEEELLFPLLRDKGLHRSEGCIGRLLAEHEENAGAFQQMVNETEACGNGDRGAAMRWASAARQYAEAMRHHIRHEEEVLFLQAEQTLSEEEQKALALEFGRLDERARRSGLEEILEDLERAAQEVGV
jgi:branched-chain amino acid transport system ATP-binding protein